MRILSSTLLLLLLGGVLVASDSDQTRELLIKQAAAWDAAICAKDKVGILANIGEGFRQVDGSGDLYSRDQFVADLLDPELSIEPYTVEKQELKISGDIAIITAETRMNGSYKGKPFKSHYRYVDIYQKQKGKWVVIYIQITKITS